MLRTADAHTAVWLACLDALDMSMTTVEICVLRFLNKYLSPTDKAGNTWLE